MALEGNDEKTKNCALSQRPKILYGVKEKQNNV